MMALISDRPGIGRMGGAAVDPFIGPAEWTKPPLDGFHQPKGHHPALPLARPAADRAVPADLGQEHIKARDCWRGHIRQTH